MSVESRWLDVFEHGDAGSLTRLARDLSEDDLGWLLLQLWNGAPEEYAFLSALVGHSELATSHPFARAATETLALASHPLSEVAKGFAWRDAITSFTSIPKLTPGERLAAVRWVAERVDDLDVRRAFAQVVQGALGRWRETLFESVASGSAAMAVVSCWVSANADWRDEIRHLAGQRDDAPIARFLTENGPR